MPHTEEILHRRSAVVSCHVERPLDDEAWSRFSRLQKRPPGGFAIAALMRPPAAGEDERLWLERAREADAHGPFGLHTHWTAPDHARPTNGDPAAVVREQGEWLRSKGLDAQHLQLGEPTWLELPSGERLLEIPTTHSIGMLARGLWGPFRRPIVHAYFHDTDLLDRRRRAALSLGLTFLNLKRMPTDLGELQRGLRPEKTMSFANRRA